VKGYCLGICERLPEREHEQVTPTRGGPTSPHQQRSNWFQTPHYKVVSRHRGADSASALNRPAVDLLPMAHGLLSEVVR
jgi:hypothetical protein